jgi:hypothetical protein
MAGKCWRLLAALLLIFVVPASLRGQDSIQDRIPFLAPELERLRSSTLIETPLIKPALIEPGRILLPPNLPLQSPAFPGAAVFSRLVSAAGIIFSGRVTSVGRRPLPSGQDPAATLVTFQVERAIRGASTGQNFTIHEWSGLWSRGERYRVGEHVLLFLYAPGKLGLTSPVAGAMGRFALDSEGRILINGQQSASFMTDPILGGKAVVPYADFVVAVRGSSREE